MASGTYLIFQKEVSVILFFISPVSLTESASLQPSNTEMHDKDILLPSFIELVIIFRYLVNGQQGKSEHYS